MRRSSNSRVPSSLTHAKRMLTMSAPPRYGAQGAIARRSATSIGRSPSRRRRRPTAIAAPSTSRLNNTPRRSSTCAGRCSSILISPAHFNLGAGLARTGDLSAAVTSFNRARRLGLDRAESALERHRLKHVRERRRRAAISVGGHVPGPCSNATPPPVSKFELTVRIAETLRQHEVDSAPGAWYGLTRGSWPVSAPQSLWRSAMPSNDASSARPLVASSWTRPASARLCEPAPTPPGGTSRSTA